MYRCIDVYIYIYIYTRANPCIYMHGVMSIRVEWIRVASIRAGLFERFFEHARAKAAEWPGSGARSGFFERRWPRRGARSGFFERKLPRSVLEAAFSSESCLEVVLEAMLSSESGLEVAPERRFRAIRQAQSEIEPGKLQRVRRARSAPEHPTRTFI